MSDRDLEDYHYYGGINIFRGTSTSCRRNFSKIINFCCTGKMLINQGGFSPGKVRFKHVISYIGELNLLGGTQTPLHTM